jgi:RNA recognition motif-containing protein
LIAIVRYQGYGIVWFSSLEEAERAIEELNGAELDGRPLLVRLDNHNQQQHQHQQPQQL